MNKARDIMKSFCPSRGNPLQYYDDVSIEQMMERFAKQESIEFVNWKDRQGYWPKQNPNSTVPQWGWMRQENQLIWSKWITDDELYNLFINQKENK